VTEHSFRKPRRARTSPVGRRHVQQRQGRGYRGKMGLAAERTVYARAQVLQRYVVESVFPTRDTSRRW